MLKSSCGVAIVVMHGCWWGVCLDGDGVGEHADGDGVWDLKDGSGFGLFGLEEICFAVSEDPVSIWITCLKEEV